MYPNADVVGSLYVHVPFCAAKCEYCAFFSEASGGETVNRYVNALVRELELVAADLKPRTVFFGGGTPSLLNLRQWRQILQAMERLSLPGADEWTVECNPATVSADKAQLLRDYGVNRISMGVQSLDAALLDRLGRVHSREMVFKSFDILRAAGFDNINLDLMFAIPGQTLETWQSTLNEAMALGSEHLSCYEVTYEADTPLYDQMRAGEFEVDEDLACDMYDCLVDCAGEHGWRQYEISNFARDERPPDGGVMESWSDGTPDQSGSVAPSHRSTSPLLHPPIPRFACRHNVNYWRGGSFYGLGPSATGYVRGLRTVNWANTQLYCEQLEKGNRAIQNSESLAPLGRAGETAAFGLRMNSGWPFAEFQGVTGFELRDQWAGEISRLCECGWGRADGERFQLTRQGLRFADAAAEMFLR